MRYKQWLNKKDISPFTKDVYIVVVKRFFSWAQETGVYYDIARGIKGVPTQRKSHHKDSLTIEQIKQVLAHIDQTTQGVRDFALINLLLKTGLRIKEVAGAMLYDIREQQGHIVLWVRGKGRHGKDEFVVLTEQVQKILAAYLDRRTTIDDNPPLFASVRAGQYGKPLAVGSISDIIKKRLRQAGLDSPRLTPHSLRHTFGVLAIQSGASLYDVQLAMRHSTPVTTQIYLADIERQKRLEASPEKRLSKLLEECGL